MAELEEVIHMAGIVVKNGCTKFGVYKPIYYTLTITDKNKIWVDSWFFSNK